MAPALPVMRAGTSIRPLFWAALGRAAARQYLCICGTESKAARIYCAIDVVVVVLATSMMTV
jgi:hypothetical protein